MKYTPYFYIIQDTKTLKYYGGSSYSKQKIAHPSKLLVEYKTSSGFVQTLLSERPDDFIVKKIRTFQTQEEATNYETRFLTKVKAMTNKNWYNYNEGFAPPPGRDRKHYNNGEVSIFINKDENPPEGFVPGRLPYQYPKNRKKKSKNDAMRCSQNRGKKCYTNGDRNIYLFDYEKIPEGYYKGTKNKGPKPQISEGMRKYHDSKRMRR